MPLLVAVTPSCPSAGRGAPAPAVGPRHNRCMPDPATQAAFALIESTPAQDLTDELAKTLERVGLDGVLADLNRSG